MVKRCKEGPHENGTCQVHFNCPETRDRLGWLHLFAREDLQKNADVCWLSWLPELGWRSKLLTFLLELLTFWPWVVITKTPKGPWKENDVEDQKTSRYHQNHKIIKLKWRILMMRMMKKIPGLMWVKEATVTSQTPKRAGVDFPRSLPWGTWWREWWMKIISMIKLVSYRWLPQC